VDIISTAIVIPARDEGASIATVLEDIRQHCDYKVIVVDDGSRDCTAKIAEQLGVTVLRHFESKGAWLAMQTGMIYARRKGYSTVITMDADGQHLGAGISALVTAGYEADVVIGSSPSRGSVLRQIARALFRKLAGLNAKDLTSGFRLYNYEALKLLTSYRASFLEYQDVGVLLFIKSAQLKVAEVAVEMNKRADGKSRIFSSWLKVLYYMASTLLLSFAKSMPDKSFRKQTENRSQ
jgi:glycosyltransferase involved in cell wall biosynthesis